MKGFPRFYSVHRDAVTVEVGEEHVRASALISLSHAHHKILGFLCAEGPMVERFFIGPSPVFVGSFGAVRLPMLGELNYLLHRCPALLKPGNQARLELIFSFCGSSRVANWEMPDILLEAVEVD